MWEMIKAEFRHIRQNRLLLLSTIVICFIPFLYSIFFLKSVWNPYGMTANLPVAVVNKDVPVDYQGHEMAVGKMMVKELKKNDQLKWEPVSAKQASWGLHHRKYYTVVTIPSDFSDNATTVMDKHPRKMQLKYETNDSLNYIGEVISQMGMAKLNEKVRQEVTTAYASAIFKVMKSAGKGFSQAADGAKQVQNGMVTLDSGARQYVAGVAQVNNGVLTLKAGVAPLASGAQQLASGSKTLAAGVQQYTSGVDLLGAGLGQLMANSGALNNGASQLATGVNQYTAGASQLGAGLNQLQANSQNLRNGAGQLSSGAAQLSSGASQLNQQVTSSLGNVDFNGIMGALNQADQLKAGLGQLQGGIAQAKSALSAASASADQLKGASSAIQGAAGSLGGLSGVAANDAAIAQEAAGLAGSTSDDKIKGQLQDIAAKAGGNAKAIQGMAGTLDQLKGLSGSISGMQDQLNKLSSLSGTLDQAGATLNQANQLLSALDSYKGTLAGMPGQMKALQAATGQLAAGAATLNSGMATAQSGINQYTAGVDTAAAGANQLQANSGTLNSGAQTLAAGVGQYTAGVGQASAGVGQLQANSGALNSGAGQLAAGLGELNGKVPTLVAGVNQLAAGTQQLAAKSPELIAGIAKLNAGAGELATKLAAGAKQANSLHPTKKNVDMIAAPSNLKHTSYSYVPNYGHALAPYVLSVALYVGSLVFNFVYPIRRVALQGRKASAWWASKVTVGLVSITAMALAEGGIMMALGLHVIHVPSFFWTLVIFGWASIAIVMFLSMTFDNPGRFFAMVLLMLQLGGSGGTFPMELTMKFYNVIHWYLPMTYSILGLRQGISGGLGEHYILMCNMVLLGIAVAFFLLLLGAMVWLQRHHFAGKSELDNNQALLAPEGKDDGMHLQSREQPK